VKCDEPTALIIATLTPIVKEVIKELSEEIALAKNERQQQGGASGCRLALGMRLQMLFALLRKGHGFECVPWAPSLSINPMPPRTTRKSDRRKVSEINVVDAEQPLFLIASETEGRRYHGTMNLRKRENHRV
jgi:hypothetical protein